MQYCRLAYAALWNSEPSRYGDCCLGNMLHYTLCIFTASCLQVLEVDAAAGVLVLGGVDIVDGSPVLDVKPYVPFSDALEKATAPHWVTVSLVTQSRAVQLHTALQNWSRLASADPQLAQRCFWSPHS